MLRRINVYKHDTCRVSSTHTFPLTVGDHQFMFLTGQYSVSKIW